MSAKCKFTIQPNTDKANILLEIRQANKVIFIMALALQGLRSGDTSAQIGSIEYAEETDFSEVDKSKDIKTVISTLFPAQ